MKVTGVRLDRLRTKQKQSLTLPRLEPGYILNKIMHELLLIHQYTHHGYMSLHLFVDTQPYTVTQHEILFLG
jgi:phage-related protein